jgi:biopolymer transport protein ExbD
MRIPLPRRLPPAGTPNLTPLIDVVLMIVIFFLVATVFRVGPGLALDLPKSTTASNVSLTELRIVVARPTEIWCGKEQTNLDGLPGLVTKAIEGKDLKKLRVVVEGGKDTTYQLVVSVLDILRKNKIEGVNLLTKLTHDTK